MRLKLTLPFKDDFPVTFPFGAVPVDQTIQSKHKEWGLKGHNGVDYGLSEGTEVLAVASGKVVQAGENGGFGISITLEHPWGISIYAHLKETKVKLGDKVRGGKVIGLSGSSGFVTGPHLHLGIKLKDADLNNGYLGYCDPMDLLERSKSR